jgi:hypothetical protein
MTRLTVCLIPIMSLCFVGICSGVGLAPGTRSINLGRVHGRSTYCHLTVSREGRHPWDVSTLHIAFFASGARNTQPVPDIVGFNDGFYVKYADFIGIGRRQLLVEATMEHVETHIFDFDGQRVRSIYEPEGGRVVVTPIRTRGGRWKLREEWGRSQFEDDVDHGDGIDVGGNCIVRYLHWNGKAFVLDRPGETRILNRHGLVEPSKLRSR